MASEDRLRVRIAKEAARIMAEEGIEDHGLAKKKAASRLGVAAHRNLPRREEIEAALTEHQRLFGQNEQPQQLAKLRQLALEAMRFLAGFSPLLVGGVWSGAAGKFSPIRLYLYAHTPEEVLHKLMETRIPYTEKFHTITRESETFNDQPALQFYVDGIRVELLLLPHSWKGQALSRKGEPVSGGNIKELETKLKMESYTLI